MDGIFSLSSRSRVRTARSVLLMAADGYCVQTASQVLVLSLHTVQLQRFFFLHHHLELLVSFNSGFPSRFL